MSQRVAEGLSSDIW